MSYESANQAPSHPPLVAAIPCLDSPNCLVEAVPVEGVFPNQRPLSSNKTEICQRKQLHEGEKCAELADDTAAALSLCVYMTLYQCPVQWVCSR